MANLLSLPIEILCQIAQHVPTGDLKNMRLVCKSLHNAANRPFGLAYFTDRRHVLSMSSIKALPEIVTHSGLGPYVSSVTMIALSPLSQDPYDSSQMSLLEAFVNSRRYMRLMKQVFDKILKYQRSVHIGISEPDLGQGLGWKLQQAFGWDDMMTAALNYDHCHMETLDNTLLAAIRANCHVRSLELSMHHYKFKTLQEALEDLLNPTRPPLKLTIHCVRKRTRELHSPYTITYDQSNGSLKLTGCDVYELARAKAGSTIKLTFAFLLSQTTKLILEDCHLCSAERFRAFLELDANALRKNLTSVRMQHFRPCRSPGADARRHWSGILESLSELHGLKYFVIEGLNRPRDWKLFHLPITTEKHEISGDDVANQLEAMATLVATEPQSHASNAITSADIDAIDALIDSNGGMQALFALNTNI
ncbi:unnamed protein product [Aureobasidium uvarum]|uniref:F-box domain-containing protein n=1 Tax=Aureobasidium uvarum TaxID=2773716 RepID=A0A9N8PPF5_9PEZI|nr:unnamed protein product [Aureobasidium uvarum]